MLGICKDRNRVRTMNFNILTFHLSKNFGAVLQTLALQEYIKSLGYSAGIFNYLRPENRMENRTFRARVSRAIGSVIDNHQAIETQEQKFSEFRKNFDLNDEIDADIFISGSDQVWNMGESLDPMFFLRFLDDTIYKASYAASMRRAQIPSDQVGLFKKYIDSFDSISVREQSVKECIEQYINKEVTVNVDPTLLHDKDFYEKYAVPVRGVPERFILAYILHIPKNGNKLLKWLKSEQNAEIVLLDNSGQIGYFIKNDLVIKDAGPGEFLWLMKNSESIVTTSFHGVCFSLIFEKEFYAIVNPASPGRISDLLAKFGIMPIQESDKIFFRNNMIDWKNVENVLQSERKASENYLRNVYKNAIARKKNNKEKNGNVVEILASCTGCGACEATCPVSAISMVLNKKGFYEPQIDQAKCINCGKCLKNCPLNQKMVMKSIKAYYGWHKDRDVLFNSSSGGAFYALSENVMRNGGIVIGAAYTDDFSDVVFRSSEEVSRNAFMKSKYTASRSSDIYPRIKKSLDLNKKVLFCGTPCQCAGVRRVFGSENENLILCDFVCGGMPSLHFFREHVSMLERKFSSKIISYDFRPKNWGWGRHRVLVSFANGKKYAKFYFADSYFKLFVNKASVRETCEECSFYHYHRSDITIADFWGYKGAGVKKNKKGMSMIICNTDRGYELLNNSEGLELYDLDISLTSYTVREKIPDDKRLNARAEFFEKSQIGFENAAMSLYDINELRYYFWRICHALHLK